MKRRRRSRTIRLRLYWFDILIATVLLAAAVGALVRWPDNIFADVDSGQSPSAGAPFLASMTRRRSWGKGGAVRHGPCRLRKPEFPVNPEVVGTSCYGTANKKKPRPPRGSQGFSAMSAPYQNTVSLLDRICTASLYRDVTRRIPGEHSDATNLISINHVF
jgi:hypothetical protein